MNIPKYAASIFIGATLLATACGSTATVVDQTSAVSEAPATTESAPPTDAPATTTTAAAPSTTETTVAETTTTTAAPTTTTTTPLYLVASYDPTRDPFADIDDAVSRAAAEEKSVVAIVGGDWCPDCINIDNFIKQRPELETTLTNQFIFVKVNLSEENENDEWISQHPDFGWVPHFYIFDGSGALTDSYDTRGLMTDGLFDESKFQVFLTEQTAS